MRICPTGQEANPSAWQYVGKTKGLNKRLFSSHYNALGQLLHIHDDSLGNKFPMFPRISDQKKAASKVEQVIDYLRSYEGAIDAHFTPVAEHTCECGEFIRIPFEILERSNLVVCPNTECFREWWVVSENDGLIWKDALDKVPCPSCGIGILIGSREYSHFKLEFSRSQRAFRPIDRIHKNILCPNPECSASIDLELIYRYQQASRG